MASREEMGRREEFIFFCLNQLPFDEKGVRTCLLDDLVEKGQKQGGFEGLNKDAVRYTLARLRDQFPKHSLSVGRDRVSLLTDITMTTAQRRSRRQIAEKQAIGGVLWDFLFSSNLKDGLRGNLESKRGSDPDAVQWTCSWSEAEDENNLELEDEERRRAVRDRVESKVRSLRNSFHTFNVHRRWKLYQVCCAITSVAPENPYSGELGRSARSFVL